MSKYTWLLFDGEIPTHDPERWQTADELGDPSFTNGDRAKDRRGIAEQLTSDDPDEDKLIDALCDLMHRLHAQGKDPLMVVDRAVNHFINEAGPV